MSDKFPQVPIFDLNAPPLGAEVFSRYLCASTLTLNTQQMRFAFFTCKRTKTYTSISVDSGTTAAAATPTLVRFGVYQENADGSLTLIGSTPNDTTLLAATLTTYTKALSASVTFQDGSRYAWAPLVVTAATAPNVAGASLATASATRQPRLAAVLSGQSDLPSSVTAATMANSSQSGGGMPYAVFS